MKKRLVKIQDGVPLSQPDPYIIQTENGYYLYTTHLQGVACYFSNTLDNFTYCGLVLEVENQKEYWAPCVIEIDNQYFMYYSSMLKKSDDVHEQRIKIATASNPLGPFTFESDILPSFSIDPHVVIYKNELYIFYSLNDYEAKRPGTYIALDKMRNPYEVENNPKRVVVPTLDQEIFEYNRFKNGQHWHTIEGAFYFNNNLNHYLMYSGSSYQRETYFIGYSIAYGDVDDLRNLEFKKVPRDDIYQPLLCKNEFIEGTGHNSVIKAGDKYYIIYHARDTNHKEGSNNLDVRYARKDELIVSKGKLMVKEDHLKKGN